MKLGEQLKKYDDEGNLVFDKHFVLRDGDYE
ncbi:hypothetical protein CPEBRM1_ABPJDJAI_00742 [Companilactobacillus paralimentarius]|jgi:hypothetical protein